MILKMQTRLIKTQVEKYKLATIVNNQTYTTCSDIAT